MRNFFFFFTLSFRQVAPALVVKDLNLSLASVVLKEARSPNWVFVVNIHSS